MDYRTSAEHVIQLLDLVLARAESKEINHQYDTSILQRAAGEVTGLANCLPEQHNSRATDLAKRLLDTQKTLVELWEKAPRQEGRLGLFPTQEYYARVNAEVVPPLKEIRAAIEELRLGHSSMKL